MAGKLLGNDIRCSFCNKTQNQVRKLIAGPAGVYICDDCIEICADILEEELQDEEEEEAVRPDINLLKPVEIKNFWTFMLSVKKRTRRCCPLRSIIITRG